ncbi:MAG: Dabb family protein [Pirellulaceae bacterium]
MSHNDQPQTMLAHMVYFSLKDAAPERIRELVDACHRYLSGHDGCVFFAAGTLNPDLAREVNVRDFHVALHTVFQNRAAHDAYQSDPRHLQFIEENKPNWAGVRVFDSDVTG